MADELIGTAANPPVSIPNGTHYPAKDVELLNQKFAAGKRLLVKVAPSKIGKRFTINLREHAKQKDIALHIDFRGKEWDKGNENCLILNERVDKKWQTPHLRYCPREGIQSIDEIFAEGMEIEVKFLDQGMALVVNGHEVIDDGQVLKKEGRDDNGPHTYNRKLDYSKMDEIDVIHSTGKFITSVEMI